MADDDVRRRETIPTLALGKQSGGQHRNVIFQNLLFSNYETFYVDDNSIMNQIIILPMSSK